ncbi:cobalamin B12-binding domain-containing protein [Candidatus Saganbacteria bacterium]|nr:cobalamin B12-binding domain-containing protein [Candidatus Saganbacteria bacterium]
MDQFKVKNTVDFLIIIPPADTVKTIYPPYGSMYIASALRNKGFNPKLLNIDLERITNAEIIERIRILDPKYIGFSGIVAPSYKYLKELSRELKNAFPEKKQILGGGLASAAAVLFNNTPIDIIVKGEGDITIVELIEGLNNGRSLENIPGIYYRNDLSYNFTGDRRLITNLDSLPYPAFDLIDLDHYLPDGLEFMRKFTKKIKNNSLLDPKRKRRMITIATSRGCFGQCSFCFRAYAGLRLFSLKYIFDLVEYCIKKYGVGFFSFGDECFAPNKQRNWQFIEEFKRRKLDVPFRILGMRVDTVDKEIIEAYKEIGCWMIEYGFESGSQKMLNIMDKRVNVEQNRRVGRWTYEAGIYTSPTIVLAMPGESDRTVRESIDFLKSLNFNFKQYQYTYALPIPGSPLYDFARLSGAIEDEDEYLTSLTGSVSGAGVFHVNLTDEPDEVVAGWSKKIVAEVDGHYFISKYKIRFLVWLFILLGKIKYHIDKNSLFAIFKKKIFGLFSISLAPKMQVDAAAVKRISKFRKRKELSFEKFCEGFSNSTINRDLALKKINQRISPANE